MYKEGKQGCGTKGVGKLISKEEVQGERTKEMKRKLRRTRREERYGERTRRGSSLKRERYKKGTAEKEENLEERRCCPGDEKVQGNRTRRRRRIMRSPKEVRGKNK